MHLLNTIFVNVSQTRAFWKARAIWGRLGFLSHLRLFEIRRGVRRSWAQTSTFLALGKLTFGQVTLAIIVAVAMQYVDPYFDGLFERYGLTITRDIYGTLLGTVTGTGAVLVGLYYAATTAIGGAIYARVPNNIRDLLATERVGNIYIRQLAFLTYLGVILLGLRAAGFSPIKIAIPIFIVSSGTAIMAFVLLGARAFNLFDPTTLSYELFDRLRRSYLQMTPRGYRWLDPSFQGYAHRTSRVALDTLATLAEITETEPHLSGQPFAKLSEQLLLFVATYESEKKRIPTASLWYSQRYSHPDWYQTGDSETTFAHTAVTALTPKTVADARWMENEILPIVYRCIRKNMKHEKFALVTGLLKYFDAYLQSLAKAHEVETALRILRDMISACDDLIFATVENEASESLERIAIADAIGAMPINIFLAYMEKVRSTSRNSIIDATNRIHWHSRSGIYKSGLPLHFLERLEWLWSRIRFEVDSENHQISPRWYVGELVLQQASENAKAAVTTLIVDVQSIYQNWISTASARKLQWILAAILFREAEYWKKVEVQRTSLRDFWIDLSRERRIEGLPWPKLDFDQLERCQFERKNALIQLMSSQATVLSRMKRPNTYPDFAGQFLHSAGEALFKAMCKNEPETVNLLFPDFFDGILLQSSRILAGASEVDWRLETSVKVAVAPLLDLMDLSGYAILFSELYENSAISDSIIAQWTEYLNSSDEKAPTSRASFLFSAISLTERAFELAHRSLVRTSWRQKVSEILRRVERKVDPKRGIFSNQSIVLHASPLVRVFAENELISSYDGIDVFIERCLRKYAGTKESELGFGRRELKRAIARENERSAGEAAQNGK